MSFSDEGSSGARGPAGDALYALDRIGDSDGAHSSLERRWLETLSRIAAAPAPSLEADEIPVLVARVGSERIGFPAGRLLGACVLDPVVPLPGARPFHLGLAARRGEILSVIDLAAWLGAGRAERPEGLCIIAAGPAGSLALRVGEIEDFRHLSPSRLEPAAAGASEGEQRATLGITADRVRLFDLDALLNHSDFRAPRAAHPERP
jgi:chemotaxis signal transduction protein